MDGKERAGWGMFSHGRQGEGQGSRCGVAADESGNQDGGQSPSKTGWEEFRIQEMFGSQEGVVSGLWAQVGERDWSPGMGGDHRSGRDQEGRRGCEGVRREWRGVSIMARARPKMKGAAPSKEGRTKTWWPLGQVRPHGHGRLPRSPPPVRSHPGFGDRLEHHRPLTPGLRPLGQRQRLPGPPLPPRRPGSRPFPRRAEPRCSSAPRPALFPAAPASLLPIARLSASTAATPERPRLAPLTSSQQPLPR